MRKDLTDLTMVVDRSGSMAATKNDAEGGIRELIRKQKEEPGDCSFSLVQFDEKYELVYNAKPIRDIVLDYVLTPRGSTALLDAVGRTIVETGERLKKTAENDRPALVMFVIITDGEENASREYTKAKIKEMIEHQEKVYKWQFVFLGANQDAFANAASIGISFNKAANYGEEKTSGALLATNNAVSRMRGQAMAGNDEEFVWQDGERKEMVS